MENQGQDAAIKHRAMLQEQARAASTAPGVYLMKDAQGQVIYVGKAKSLRNRLSQYFVAAIHEVMRTELMVRTVGHFDVILTETEAEALILENTLIKKHRPKYNVRMKDDKTYPYIKISIAEEFPRLEWTRKVKRDGARYFGPFPSSWGARQVLRLLTEAFKLRDCSDNTFSHRSRACILYQMGKCSGPCVGHVSKPDYRSQLDEVIAVLEGKENKWLKGLRQEMEAAAEDLNFERAAEIRDDIRNIELVTQMQMADEAGSGRSRDVIALARSETHAQVAVLKIRGGRMLAVQHFSLQNSDATQDGAQVFLEFLSLYLHQEYPVGREGPVGSEALNPPQDILVTPALAEGMSLPIHREALEILERTFGMSLKTVESQGAGSDEAALERLLSVAQTNAQYALEQALKTFAGHGVKALEEVAEKLHLPSLPMRIECFDNSNFQGTDAVASRVVFIEGAPDKNLYRRYKIKTVEGANDFASMKEILGRRFARLGELGDEKPDLVVVDGGKGQLSQAVAIMEELGVQGVAVVGLAKARTESDFQSSEVKSSEERIFIPGRKNPIPLRAHTAAYKLLTHVRDEAHRFAISYHRNVRDKRTLG